ncbi:TPA: hypothetical protein ACTZ3H_004144 [Bacillus cereus]|uniref:hypothetical protein n=1 Tax=Bacillus cereus TaxID=1396 RepID=UPI001F60C687|nr:hypothetical protein [Bacillus cereus]MCU5695359.1 hypothetical protein [Bacillus cereus]
MVVEMKYKSAYVSEEVFSGDVNKIIYFFNSWGNVTKRYLAFIQEKDFKTEDLVNCLEDEQAYNVTGKATELYAYWSQDSEGTVLSITNY